MAKKSLPKSFSIDNLEFSVPPKHYRFMDLTGQTFGRLYVLGYAGKTASNSAFWCKCACGTIHRANAYCLRSGKSQSCGCLSRELSSKRMMGVVQKGWNATHGKCRTRIYIIWNGMKDRCTNPNAKKYLAYGGRGITVCDRWRDFANFYADMGEPPSRKHSIDRIDVNGPYEPGNCRWATATEQQRNRRDNIWVEIDGVRKTVSEWETISPVSHGTLGRRLRRPGWCNRCAVFLPPQPTKSRPNCGHVEGFENDQF